MRQCYTDRVGSLDEGLPCSSVLYSTTTYQLVSSARCLLIALIHLRVAHLVASYSLLARTSRVVSGGYRQAFFAHDQASVAVSPSFALPFSCLHSFTCPTERFPEFLRSVLCGRSSTSLCLAVSLSTFLPHTEELASLTCKRHKARWPC